MIIKRRSTRNKSSLFSNIYEGKAHDLCNSQDLMIKSVCNQSLLDPLIKAVLPPQLENIYNTMMDDLSFITDTQTTKDYDFFKFNMTFLNGEDIVMKKRKFIQELSIKNRFKSKKKTIRKFGIELIKKTKSIHKKKGGIIKNLNNDELSDMEEYEREKDSLTFQRDIVHNGFKKQEREYIPERNTARLTKKKLFAIETTKGTKLSESQSKEVYNNETSSVYEKLIKKNGIRPIEENKKGCKKLMLDEDIGHEDPDYSKERRLSSKLNIKRKVPLALDHDQPLNKRKVAKVCDKLEKTLIKGGDYLLDEEIIDLSSEDSTDDNAIMKSKVYFREPTLRKQSTMNCKKLKEHTLLDKIMLGINCVRQWTEKGLHLTRITENDLGLLNKRLSSAKCTMSELKELTDENNNKSLTVLIQSEMFSNLPQVIFKPISTTKTSLEETKNRPLSPDNNTQVSRPRPKHISSMYRHKHNLPSILSKPTLLHETNFKKTFSKLNTLPRFSEGVKVEDEMKTQLPEVVENQLSSDPSMSVSQLLKIKNNISQNSTIKIKPNIAEEDPQPSLPIVQASQLPHPNVMLNMRPAFIYQSLPRHNFVFPLQLAHPKLVPFPQNSFRFPSKTVPRQSMRFTNLSRFQHIPVNKSFLNNANRLPNPEDTSSVPQASILKNLLQQTNQQVFPNRQLTLSSSHMVPLSVFQSNKTKWQVGSLSQYQLKK